ncbi:hypothetical protein HYU92_01750 [Candidatus Curtissbacteria bacterium]|nr:hypothetical protein [Candidatus Curtissbacteria bacterium]
MNSTKLVLSIIGVSAVVIPAVLLTVMASKTSQVEISSGKRPLNAKILEDASKKLPSPSPILPTPSPSSPSASVGPAASP